jgi:hypothetical protein
VGGIDSAAITLLAKASNAAVPSALKTALLFMDFLLFPAFVKILHNITIHRHVLDFPRHQNNNYDQSLIAHIDLGQAA